MGPRNRAPPLKLSHHLVHPAASAILDHPEVHRPEVRSTRETPTIGCPRSPSVLKTPEPLNRAQATHHPRSLPSVMQPDRLSRS